MRSSVTDMVAGIFSLLFGAIFYAQSRDLEGVALEYPMWLIGFIMLGGLFLVLQGLRKRMKGGEAQAADDEPTAYSRVGIISLASASYVALIFVFGFYPASAVFLFGSAMLLNDAGLGVRKSALAACALTGIMCIAVWACFGLLLQVPTPEGLLF